jgi:hypothetical protein
MGSQVSPAVANLVMEDFEENVLNTSLIPEFGIIMWMTRLLFYTHIP